MSFNNPYNQLDSAYQGELTNEEGNIQAKTTAEKKTKEALAEGLGGGLIAPSGMDLLKKVGTKVIRKVAPKTVQAIEDVSKGDYTSISKGASNLYSKGEDAINDTINKATSKISNMRPLNLVLREMQQEQVKLKGHSKIQMTI